MNPFRAFTIFFSLVFSVILLTSCGKRRPPQPPFESVPQRTDLLSGVQRGNQVILSFPAPQRNAPDVSVQSIRRIDVYRLAEPSDAPVDLTEEEFSARATLVGSIPFQAIQSDDGTIVYTDVLNLTEPVRLRYAIRFVNASGQRAAFSNFLLVEPASNVSLPPTLADETSIKENAIIIRWSSPAANVDGSKPPNILGYNVYRSTRLHNEPAQTPLNGERPINAVEFADLNFAFGEQYVYVVRAVSLGTGGNPVESLNSNPLRVSVRDVFAPQPPTGLTAAAAAGGRISIFWAANPENDVAGYNIYRSSEPNLPKDQWTKLNRQILERTTFQDDAVQTGLKYYYYITVQDRVGNISPASEIVSETAP